jgi:hypothetical protein
MSSVNSLQSQTTPDDEIRKNMKNRSSREDIINRGSSTRLTPKEEDEEIEKLDERQKKDMLDIRHKGVYIYKKSARQLQKKIEKIDELIHKSSDQSEINTLNAEKKALRCAKRRKDATAIFSIRGRVRKRRQSFGGKTKKKVRKKNRRRKTKRRKRRKRRKTRRKKGGKVHYNTSLTVNTTGR